MHRVNVLAGKTQCRYCGEQIAIKALTAHIHTRHARPVSPRSMKPTLVKKAVSTAPDR